MAEIPVEHKEKSGLPWWLIPLALLILLPLLFFGFCNRGTNVVVDNTNNNVNRTIVPANINGNTMSATNANNNVALVVNSNVNTNLGNETNSVVNAARVNTGPMITDTSFFAGVNDKMSLVGRDANFSSVRVGRVLSDRVFTVASGAGEMFVMLDESLDSSGGKESQIKIRPGQNLNLSGNFRAVPNAETRDEQNRDLDKSEYAQMKDQKIYLNATSVSDAK